MNTKEKRNRFLVEMHELEERFRPTLEALELPDGEDNFAVLALNKFLEFSENFKEDSFFESLTGSILAEYFIRLTEEILEFLEDQKGKKPIYYFLQSLFGIGPIPSYLDDCTFIEASNFADLGGPFSMSLANYIMLHEDMTKEECGYIFAVVKEEIVALEDEETALAIIEDTVAILLENDSFKEKIESFKVLRK